MSQLQSRVDENGKVVFNLGPGAPVKMIPGYHYHSKEALLAQEKRRKEEAFREKEEERMNSLKAPTTKLAGLENAGAVPTTYPVAEKPRNRRRPMEKEDDNESYDMDIEANNLCFDGQPQQQQISDSVMEYFNF